MNAKRCSIFVVLSGLLVASQVCAQSFSQTGTISPSFPGPASGATAGRSIVESMAGRMGVNSANGAGPFSSGVFGGSVPEQAVTADAIPLTLSDSIARGLRNNLGLLLSKQG